jgi:putative transposase
MARLPRLTAAGYPHHVIQRGNNRQAIFADAADCTRFLQELGALLEVHEVALHAYVLMPNHVHLLLTPATQAGLSALMQALGRRYVAWFNRRHARTGALFEGRFRSSVVESERYLLACARYIEMNPVRAGLVTHASEYRWSSIGHHAGLRVDPLITEHPLIWALGNTPFERQAAYRRLFDADLPESTLSAIRSALHRSWALGSDTFRAGVTSATRRTARGRPRKQPVPI